MQSGAISTRRSFASCAACVTIMPSHGRFAVKIKGARKLRKEPKQDRARATLDAIVIGARDLLRLEGKDALTMSRVAERAGVSTASIYQYVDNREVLLERVIEAWLNELYLAVEQAQQATAAQPIEKRLLAVVATFVEHKRRTRDLSIHLSEMARKSDETRDLVDTAMGFGERLLADLYADADSNLSEEAATKLGVWAMNAVDGVVANLTQRGPEALEDPQLIPMLHRILLAVPRQ